MEPLILAIAQHLLDTCPDCNGAGEVVTSTSVMFGRPMAYATCERCKKLRASIKNVIARNAAH